MGAMLYIDYGLCKGCGACAEIFPSIFVMRDEKAWVIIDEILDVHEHRKIVTVCAFGAISIEY